MKRYFCDPTDVYYPPRIITDGKTDAKVQYFQANFFSTGAVMRHLLDYKIPRLFP